MLRAALEAQAPPKQNATDTINTLSSRLTSATLLEDRRGAILGLRSFAKEYPASVASGALRPLISTLNRDVGDVDTGKVVLETLLALFEPNTDSPEASPEVTLWLADSFTQRLDNITILLDLLENDDFYSRLYALQLLSAISGARPERTQESILSAPLGVGRLVSVLDDAREAIVSAGLMLLNDITNGSTEVQNLVVFNGALDHIFRLMQHDGALTEGGLILQDCLSLLAILLHLNTSNQSLFRETGFVGQLSKLLSDDAQWQQGREPGEYDGQPTREKNIWGLLVVLRMFLIQGNTGCRANQLAFEKGGLLQLILNLAFSQDLAPPLRAEALKTCADIIRGNSSIQERFAHHQVPHSYIEDEKHRQANGHVLVYIIDALLDVALNAPSLAMFDVRYAASQCIQSYFYNHTPIRQHFLQRAIGGHTSDEDETGNVLTILIRGSQAQTSVDPYRIWFAAEIVTQLLHEDPLAKEMIGAVVEGDAQRGEDVVTCAQTLSGNLIEALQAGHDDRVAVGYLMVLCTWLFEDARAVNDVLSEGSAVQSLVQVSSSRGRRNAIVHGLCAVLAGILYEFSTKDSPIPRRKLQPMLLSGIGREYYISSIRSLREHQFVRDFEILPQNSSLTGTDNQPDVFFNQTFVEFLKDNFSRFTRAIDRDPGMEILPQDESVDRDLVDSLRSQLKDKDDALQRAQSDILDIQGRLGQEQQDHRKLLEKSTAEMERVRNINQALQASHETEIGKVMSDHREEIRSLAERHNYDIENHTKRSTRARDEAAVRAQQAEDDLRRELGGSEARIRDLQRASTEANRMVDELRKSNSSLTGRIREAEEQMRIRDREKQALEDAIASHDVTARGLKEQIAALERYKSESGSEQTRLQVELNSKEEARAAVQIELDDLLIVLGDLEEKRSRDKKMLRELGATTSDDDEEGEDDDEDDEDDEDEDGEDGEDEDEDEGEGEEQEDRESVTTDDRPNNTAGSDKKEARMGKSQGESSPVGVGGQRPSHVREESID